MLLKASFNILGITQFFEVFAHVSENQKTVRILIFHISKKQHSKLLELTALRCIK